MVRNPFKKRTQTEKTIPDVEWPKEIIVRHSGLSTMTHVIEKMPDPKPVREYLLWTNQVGQRWQTPQFPIYGQASVPIDVPIAWLTGRDKDIARLPINVTLILEY